MGVLPKWTIGKPLPKRGAFFRLEVQLTPDNGNLQSKLEKVGVIGSSNYGG